MKQTKTDIAIHGAGIAGLWIFHRLKSMGHDALLLETEAIGAGQTLASQGIIHSGLKYAIAGQVSELARSISAMPELWRARFPGAESSQIMLIPDGLIGQAAKLVAKGLHAREIETPAAIKSTGFKGSAVQMNEPVLDISQIIRALAEPYKDSIRKPDGKIDAKIHIYTAAASNHEIATIQKHDKGLETQKRPLLMGMMKPAPFHLNAHLIGASEKPVATITTHKTQDGTLVWYLGGLVAERKKESPPAETINAAKSALKKYLPALDLSKMQWAVLPIDRVEGKSGTSGWMPDTPTIHKVENHLYCWPTKLTFAPMLSDMILKHIDFKPSGTMGDYAHLPPVDYAAAPWDKASWKSDL